MVPSWTLTATATVYDGAITVYKNFVSFRGQVIIERFLLVRITFNIGKDFNHPI